MKIKRPYVLLLFAFAGVILGGKWLISNIGMQNKKIEYKTINILDESGAFEYLESCGKTPVSDKPYIEKIQIPYENNYAIYDTYLSIQEEQKLPFSEYCGQTATRMSYVLKEDYKNNTVLVAELIIDKSGRLLGAAWYDSARFDRIYPIV